MDRADRKGTLQSMREQSLRAAKISRLITVGLVGIAVIGLAVFGFVISGNLPNINLPGLSSGENAKPSAAEIYTAVENGLRTGGSCSGERTVKNLKVTGVGEYVPQFGGYPVYGAASTTCRKGNFTTTVNSSDKPNVAITFVRKSFGGWEAFTPEIFQRAQDEMQKSFNNMLGNIK